MEDVQPWDRQPGERRCWYQRFDRFRLKGPSRSVREVWQEELQAAGKREPRSGRPSSYWYEMARLWRWQERAGAWDESERLRLEARVRAALDDLMEAAPEAVQALVDSLADPRERVRAANSILDRAGLPVTIRQETYDRKPPRSARELTDDELAAIAARDLPARSGAGNEDSPGSPA